MLVLLLGHRLGITKALDKLKIPYILWATKPIKNKLKSIKTIMTDYPETIEGLKTHFDDSFKITHVIAGGENAVIPASQIRRWLKLKRNSHSVILKCTDKLMMKEYLSQKGVHTTSFLSSKKTTAEDIVNQLGLPVVCKEKLNSGGRGVIFLKTVEDVNKHLSKNVYFEKIIKGKEGSIESLVVNNKIIFSSLTEYYINGQCNIIPPNFSDKLCTLIKELNNKVIESLNIKWGLTHLEYYLTDEGVLFGEVALRPPGGYIMETLENVFEQSFWESFVKVETGVTDIDFNQQKNYSASIIIHPGPGTIKRVNGLEKIKKMKSFKKIKLKAEKGNVVQKRDGVGQDLGYLLLTHKNQAQLNNDIDFFYKNFQILMETV